MPRPGYRTAAQEHGASMRASGRSYRGGYTRSEIRERKSYTKEDSAKPTKEQSEKIKDTWKIKDTAIFGGKKYYLHSVAFNTKEKAVDKAESLRKFGYSVIRDKRSFGHILWKREK